MVHVCPKLTIPPAPYEVQGENERLLTAKWFALSAKSRATQAHAPSLPQPKWWAIKIKLTEDYKPSSSHQVARLLFGVPRRFHSLAVVEPASRHTVKSRGIPTCGLSLERRPETGFSGMSSKYWCNHSVTSGEMPGTARSTQTSAMRPCWWCRDEPQKSASSRYNPSIYACHVNNDFGSLPTYLLYSHESSSRLHRHSTLRFRYISFSFSGAGLHFASTEHNVSVTGSVSMSFHLICIRFSTLCASYLIPTQYAAEGN